MKYRLRCGVCQRTKIVDFGGFVPMELSYECPRCDGEWMLDHSPKPLDGKGWQDQGRTETSVEIVYKTRYDCNPVPGGARRRAVA